MKELEIMKNIEKNKLWDIAISDNCDLIYYYCPGALFKKAKTKKNCGWSRSKTNCINCWHIHIFGTKADWRISGMDAGYNYNFKLIEHEDEEKWSKDKKDKENAKRL